MAAKNVRHGTAAAALAHRDFRTVWAGALGSNVGTWMQNAALGAYAWNTTHSTGFVGLLYLAQLGPQFVLAVPGGVVVDRFDRRRVLIATQIIQMVFAIALVGAVAVHGDLQRVLLVIGVAFMGIANTLFAPAWSALIAQLVGYRDLPGAVSLGFLQINLSRVIGPFLGVVVYAHFGISVVFVINGVSYLIAIVSLFVIDAPPAPVRSTESLGSRVRAGLVAAGADPVVAWSLRTIGLFSFFSLSFLSLLPAMADKLYGISAKSTTYAALFAVFGFGAACGAISVGTVLVHRVGVSLVRVGFAAFTVSISAFAVGRSRVVAFPAIFCMGLTYFIAVTALSTGFQQRLDHEVRGRVMALWFMLFGGVVPIGAAAMSVFAEQTNLTAVLLVGAVAAAVLATTRPRSVRAVVNPGVAAIVRADTPAAVVRNNPEWEQSSRQIKER